MKHNNLIFTGLGVLVIAAGMAIHVAQASDDSIGFYMYINNVQRNSFTEERYRQTLNNTNPWKVNLTSSGEGQGTLTTFWLEHGNGTNVSKAYDTKQGSGKHYHSAYTSASESYVRLTAENNNYNLAGGYSIKGYWDEETN